MESRGVKLIEGVKVKKMLLLSHNLGLRFVLRGFPGDGSVQPKTAMEGEGRAQGKMVVRLWRKHLRVALQKGSMQGG